MLDVIFVLCMYFRKVERGCSREHEIPSLYKYEMCDEQTANMNYETGFKGCHYITEKPSLQ